ncbi:MAG: hypothetical protein KDD66_00045 [Bdellovibrionales bacterium]|nr:hypothetical protein [Bdellovibrionales bacterium]
MAKHLLHSIGSLPSRLLQRIVSLAVAQVTKPITLYSPSEVTNLRALKRRLRKCDVLLICGDARVSHVVKVLTLSQWSHVVLYVGDRQDMLSDAEIEEWSAKYGRAALEHLVVDADPVRGVHLKPLDDSVGLMIRHCRPEALKTGDRDRVVELALQELGREYDVTHILQLLLFFAFPWEILPEFLRRIVRDFTLSEDDRICSRVLSESFHQVGYPIRPINVIENKKRLHNKALTVASGIKHRSKTAARLFAGGRFKAAVNRLADKRYYEFHMRGTRYIVPADYDLSRFFSVIKNPDDLKIDYRQAKSLVPLVQHPVEVLE